MKMAKWIVADSLSCPEQFFGSHLSSYSWYLKQAGEEVSRVCWNFQGDGECDGEPITLGSGSRWDVAFVLDRYDAGAGIWAEKRIAQVAALCDPMPWNVRKPDGSPAYDLVISSIPAMVEQARAAGCRAELQKLCFDHRALVCSMGVKKDIDCLFVGTIDGNHRKRAEVLRELGDLVTVAPPTYGREMYRLTARAKTVAHISAEWAGGSRNALRLYEACGLSALAISDGPMRHQKGDGPGAWANTSDEFRERILKHVAGDPISVAFAHDETARTLTEDTYVQRVPELINWARGMLNG